MPTQRQKNARSQEAKTAMVRESRKLLDERKAQREPVSIPLPEKGTKPQSEIVLLGSGEKLRTTLPATTMAIAFANRPDNVLEIPLVDKRGNVRPSWLRAGAIGGVIDLTGMTEWPAR